MKIDLKLKPSCLETVAKRAYEGLIKRYFHKNATDERRHKIEKEMVPLHHFLNHVDFAALRSLHPELSGMEALSVVLHIQENEIEDEVENARDAMVPWDDPETYWRSRHHAFLIKVNDKTIFPIWK